MSVVPLMTQDRASQAAMKNAAWDDSAWQETDAAWTSGCRWLQSRWREKELGLPAGPHRASRPERVVASMLPIVADRPSTS